MKQVIFRSLVKGQRYEKEYDYLNSELSKLKLDYSKYTPAVFNFNKKLETIEHFLDKIVVLLDTDHILRKPFKVHDLQTLDEGIYVKYSKPYLTKDTLESDIELYDYFDILKNKYGSNCINFLDESIIIFNILDTNKISKFISSWKYLIHLTKDNSPYRFSDKTSGALEGCLISIAAQQADIKIYSDKLSEFFECFYHYGPVDGHRTKIDRTVV